MSKIGREQWCSLSDSQLLAQCEVDTYRASGPGGQKRNKTSSAVRLRHPPSGLLVIAEESRSQHENRARALKRLREAIYLKCRELVSCSEGEGNNIRHLLEILTGPCDRLLLGKRDPRFWPVAGLVLDVLNFTEGKLSEASNQLGISTGNLIDFLQTSPKLWEQVNYLRKEYDLKPLKNT